MGLKFTRIAGLMFAATALLGTALWLVTGASAPRSIDEEDQEAARNGAVYMSVNTTGKLSDADRIAARLRAEGYSSTDTKQGAWDLYGHNLVIDQPFSDQQALTLSAKFRQEFAGVKVRTGSRDLLFVSGELRRGRRNFSYETFIGFLTSFGDTARLAMLTSATEIVTAGALAIWLLLKRRHSAEVLGLGFALGCFSLYAFYLVPYSVAPLFGAYQPTTWGFRIALDVAAVELVVAGFYAFTKFWETFPHPVPKGELESFLQARREKQFEVLGLSRPIGRTQMVGERTKLTVMIILGLFAGLVWTGGFLIPGDWPEVVIQVVFGVFLLVVLYWQGLTCLRLFSYHRANGSADDKRKIEWVSASLWMAFVVMLAPLAAMAVLKVGGIFILELDDWSDYALATQFVAISLAPTLVFVAIGLSIQYRGSVDPKLALRGFTVWTLLSVVLTLVFVFVERTVALRLVGWWHLPPQTGYVTAGAIVAATFQPIRKRMEKWVNRFVERVLPETLLASGKRETCAVAVVDISGYTALTAKDEQAALLASALLQKEAHRIAEAHQGRVVKSKGDGVISAFPDAGACLAAVEELHRTVTARAGALDLPALSLHSGLHWGEVVEMHDGDIYGMTVNLATRIADWAKAGEIAASEAFHAQLAAPATGWVPVGPQSFKNVPEPVACLRLSVA